MLPDVHAFVSDVLLALGALVEHRDEGLMAVLPSELAKELGVPDACRLSALPAALGHDDTAHVPCGFGTPTLERLIETGRATSPVATARLEVDSPRAPHARSLAARFTPRNGLSEVLDVTQCDVAYVLATFAWAVEADDRYEGLLSAVLAVEDGAEPDAAFRAIIDPMASSSLLGAREALDDASRHAVAGRLAPRVRVALTSAVAPALESIRRRHARDHERITDYFSSMINETLSPKRRVDSATLRAKVEQMVRERDAKLRELPNRFTARVSVTPAALLWVTAPSVVVRVELRRRKQRRELLLRMPSGAQSLDRLSCDGCGGTTARPALCDDQLHSLCETCVPSAQGRPKCAKCASAA